MTDMSNFIFDAFIYNFQPSERLEGKSVVTKFKGFDNARAKKFQTYRSWFT